MNTFMRDLILDAASEQVERDGTYSAMSTAELAFSKIDPADYEQTLRIVIGQWVATVTPERSTP